MASNSNDHARGATDGTTGEDRGARQESALDRRRRKLWRARNGADDATAAVRQLEERIDANAEQGRTHEANLRAALDEVASLKKAIKASAKEADKLHDSREAARERAAEAQQRAAVAESKYDDAVLADLLRREKDNDLAAHADPRATDDPGHRRDDEGDDSVADSGGADGTASPRQDRSDEVPESTTARDTAARHTATRARTTTGQRGRSTTTRNRSR